MAKRKAQRSAAAKKRAEQRSKAKADSLPDPVVLLENVQNDKMSENGEDILVLEEKSASSTPGSAVANSIASHVMAECGTSSSTDTNPLGQTPASFLMYLRQSVKDIGGLPKIVNEHIVLMDNEWKKFCTPENLKKSDNPFQLIPVKKLFSRLLIRDFFIERFALAQSPVDRVHIRAQLANILVKCGVFGKQPISHKIRVMAEMQTGRHLNFVIGMVARVLQGRWQHEIAAPQWCLDIIDHLCGTLGWHVNADFSLWIPPAPDSQNDALNVDKGPVNDPGSPVEEPNVSVHTADDPPNLESEHKAGQMQAEPLPNRWTHYGYYIGATMATLPQHVAEDAKFAIDQILYKASRHAAKVSDSSDQFKLPKV